MVFSTTGRGARRRWRSGGGLAGPGGKNGARSATEGLGAAEQANKQASKRSEQGQAGRRQAGGTHLQGTGGRAWQGSVRGAAGAALRAPNGGRGAGEDKGRVHESKCSARLIWRHTVGGAGADAKIPSKNTRFFPSWVRRLPGCRTSSPRRGRDVRHRSMVPAAGAMTNNRRGSRGDEAWSYVRRRNAADAGCPEAARRQRRGGGSANLHCPTKCAMLPAASARGSCWLLGPAHTVRAAGQRGVHHWHGHILAEAEERERHAAELWVSWATLGP